MDEIVWLGKSPGLSSFIDGTAGAEKPRTSAQQKYDHDTHIDRIDCKYLMINNYVCSLIGKAFILF